MDGSSIYTPVDPGAFLLFHLAYDIVVEYFISHLEYQLPVFLKAFNYA